LRQIEAEKVPKCRVKRAERVPLWKIAARATGRAGTGKGMAANRSRRDSQPRKRGESSRVKS